MNQLTSRQHCTFNQRPQHCLTIRRFDQPPQVFAINRHDTQAVFAIAQGFAVKGLGKAFGADQEAQLAMAATRFELAVKLDVFVLADALGLPVFGFDEDEAVPAAPERIGARVAQHQLSFFRRCMIVAFAYGEAGDGGKERC